MTALDDMLAGALGGIPRLSGNLCRGEGELFDDFEDPEVVEYCLPTPLQALPRAF